MNWKEHFDKIKIGDVVTLKKYNTCGGASCCRNAGYEIGKQYHVTHMKKWHGEDGVVLNSNCSFPLEFVEKA